MRGGLLIEKPPGCAAGALFMRIRSTVPGPCATLVTLSTALGEATAGPADEGGAAVDIGEVLARKTQPPVMGRAGGKDHGIVEPLQFGDGDVLAHGDVADEADVAGQRHGLVPAGHALDRLVIGRHPGADQAEGHGQPVEYVDADLVAPLLLRGFRRVIARRSRSDHCDVAHAVFSFSRRAG